uniref:Uncharacterized protein n=1 Tax=viral metagenome TaxID=1070528 RepID=A0A6C0E8X5_9ZZZZ
MESLINSFDKTMKEYLKVFDDKYVSAGATLFLIVYASYAAARLPSNLSRLFDNLLVKLFMFFMLIYILQKDVKVALVSSVAVMVVLMALNSFKTNEMMDGDLSGEEHQSEEHRSEEHPQEEHGVMHPLLGEEHHGQPVGVESHEETHSCARVNSEEEESHKHQKWQEEETPRKEQEQEAEVALLTGGDVHASEVIGLDDVSTSQYAEIDFNA